MTDYYPVLTRAVAALAANDIEGRRQLYGRARAILAAELRRRQPADLVATAREQAALEAAIGRVEAQALASAAPPPQPAPQVHAAPPAKKTATTLARILDDLESADAPPAATPQALSTLSTTLGDITPAAREEFAAAPRSIGALLFGIAYSVAALAFIGATYIRCMVGFYQGAIGVVTVLAVMAFTIGLFAAPVIYLRRGGTVPPVNGALRIIHSASRWML